MLGTLRVDENLYPIESITLIQGGLQLFAHCHGPMPAASGPVRIHTNTGGTVTDMADNPYPTTVTIPQIGEHDCFKFTYTLTFTAMNLEGPGSSTIKMYGGTDGD